MSLLRRAFPLTSSILETVRSLSSINHHSIQSTNFSIMSTTPKKPDATTGSQGEPLPSKEPTSSDNANRRYEIIERGQLHTLSYRCYFRDTQTNTIVSPFHDIPLVNEDYTKSNENQNVTIYNMVVEVPRWTNAKMEINKQFKMNPLVQDVKNGKPRFVHNVFPYHGYLWNYGALPQTWEDPNHVDEDTKTTGDNDPIDVCEIGTTLHATGSVIPVKIVGVLGLIDEGETDWKLIGIDIRDKLASQIHDINDVDKHLPGLLEATLRWFKYYKVPTGKPPNQFALNEQYGDRAYANRVIDETRKYWEKLASGETKVEEKVCAIANTTLNNRGTISKDDAEKIVEADEKHQKEPAKLDASIHQLSYVKDNEERSNKEKKIMTLNSLVQLNKISKNLWHLLFNRPTYHNAFNTEFAQQLIARCQQIRASKDIRSAVIVSGQGKSFCSGADLKERQHITEPKQWMEQHHIFEQMFNSLAQLKLPTIACVEGFALAGGFELALNCDMIVASRSASFGLPEVTRGIMPGGGGTQLLARLVGPARAKQIAITGRKLNAQEAFDMGIVQILTEDGQALERGIELGMTIAANAPLATQAIKQAIDEGWGKSTDDAKAIELTYYKELIDTEDRHEGIRAFNEKRKPQWKGN
ncbi:unnamed protein product [Adineta ricciae]|uniref:inorganic diphosphatase n=1 Tax=Adineta ricciae TaxID=249248 RepID=A0A815Z2X9_ADIRI|nr:unnamed protein product [Adineta ricciae]